MFLCVPVVGVRHSMRGFLAYAFAWSILVLWKFWQTFADTSLRRGGGRGGGGAQGGGGGGGGGGAGLFDSAPHVIKLTAGNFPDSETHGGGAVHIVKFYAPWCDSAARCNALRGPMHPASDRPRLRHHSVSRALYHAVNAEGAASCPPSPP